jgi:anti-sigma regulatory factor (Ser/Thr protein kinase)
MTSPPALRSTADPHSCIPPALFPPGPDRQWRIFRGRAPELARLRRWLVRLLPDTPARDDVVSIAVELATNAIQHTVSGQGGAFTVEIRWLAEPSTIRVTVADAGAAARPKWQRRAPGVVTSGYGLYMVRRLASRTGVSGSRRGRHVWAEVPWTIPPARWTRPGPGADRLEIRGSWPS